MKSKRCNTTQLSPFVRQATQCTLTERLIIFHERKTRRQAQLDVIGQVMGASMVSISLRF